MDIRLADLEDVPQILKLGREFFECSGFQKFYSRDDETIVELLEGLITQEPHFVLVADKNVVGSRQVVGFVGIGIFPHPLNKSILVSDEFFMWVDPQYRSNRVGSDLFRFANKEIERRGVNVAIFTALRALSHDRVCHLYERAGYEPVGTTFIRRV